MAIVIGIVSGQDAERIRKAGYTEAGHRAVQPLLADMQTTAGNDEIAIAIWTDCDPPDLLVLDEDAPEVQTTQNPSGKDLRRTTIAIEVLHEGPFEWDDLAGVHNAITYGECSGKVWEEKAERLSDDAFIAACREQGSDPAFFGLIQEDEPVICSVCDGEIPSDEHHHECRECGAPICNRCDIGGTLFCQQCRSSNRRNEP